MSRAVLIHADALLNRAALRTALPAAWGGALAAGLGGSPDEWASAYRRIQDDWHSYWADLDLGGDDSLAQWREGRWRVVRGLFRLAGRAAPPVEQMPHYLDIVPREVGRLCPAWGAGAIEALGQLAGQGFTVALLAPYTASALLWGMLDRTDRPHGVSQVLGPDELEKVGLEGFAPAYLARLAGADPAETVHITQPDDLFTQVRLHHHRLKEP
jgi:hypothetical protein